MNNPYIKYGGIILLVVLAFFLAYKYKGNAKVAIPLVALAFIAGGILVGYSSNRIVTTTMA